MGVVIWMRFDCSLGEGIVLLFVVTVSCVSGALVYMLVRLCLSLQSLKGFVLNVMNSKSCFHFVFYTYRMSSVVVFY